MISDVILFDINLLLFKEIDDDILWLRDHGRVTLLCPLYAFHLRDYLYFYSNILNEPERIFDLRCMRFCQEDFFNEIYNKIINEDEIGDLTSSLIDKIEKNIVYNLFPVDKLNNVSIVGNSNDLFVHDITHIISCDVKVPPNKDNDEWRIVKFAERYKYLLDKNPKIKKGEFYILDEVKERCYSKNIIDYDFYEQNIQKNLFEKWWTHEHDEMVLSSILKHQWLWYMNIVDDLSKITSAENSSEISENQILVYAICRARIKGYDKLIRNPIAQICPLCEKQFYEDSVHHSLVFMCGGVENIKVCNECGWNAIDWNIGDEKMNRKGIEKFIKKLTKIIKRIPKQNFGYNKGDLNYYNTEEQIIILKLLKEKPTLKRIKECYGSWIDALMDSGVVKGYLKTGYGFKCRANDGHICDSLDEKIIDDLLYSNKIPHQLHPKYPKTNYKADFDVGGIYIEYFGLIGIPEYDMKIDKKMKIAENNKIKLFCIYPEDLLNLKELENRFIELFK